MFGRKKQLLQQSNMYRAIGNLSAQEGLKKFGQGVLNLGIGHFNNNPVSKVKNAWDGGYKIGESWKDISASIEYHKAADELEEKARNSKWWQF